MLNVRNETASALILSIFEKRNGVDHSRALPAQNRVYIWGRGARPWKFFATERIFPRSRQHHRRL